MPLLPVLIMSTLRRTADLFHASAMYDDDYLHFFAAPRDLSEGAMHGHAANVALFRWRCWGQCPWWGSIAPGPQNGFGKRGQDPCCRIDF